MSFLREKTTKTTTKTTTKANISKNKKSFCCGINNYPGTNNDLRGCVNDAKAWSSLLEYVYGFKSELCLDNKVTHHKFVQTVGNLLSDSKSGDDIVITFSGHGTNVADNDGDESDGRDEALCLYDAYLIDDQIRDLFKLINPNAKLTFISDSCHSGTNTRSFMQTLRNVNNPIPRFMPPEDDFEAYSVKGADIKGKIFHPESGMKEILISGCLPQEYSYDAHIGGAFRGAMSFYAIEILKKYPTITYNNFHAQLKKILPSNQYPQTPQLEGSEENKKRIMFS